MKGYKDYTGEWILRDYLAYDRTRLALVRTFLSFARTSLGLLASGLGLLIVKNSPMMQVAGWFVIAVAVVVLVAGGVYCLHVKHRLDELALTDEGE